MAIFFVVGLERGSATVYPRRTFRSDFHKKENNGNRRRLYSGEFVSHSPSHQRCSLKIITIQKRSSLFISGKEPISRQSHLVHIFVKVTSVFQKRIKRKSPTLLPTNMESSIFYDYFVSSAGFCFSKCCCCCYC